MKLACSQRRALCVLAGFAAIQATPTQAADDKSTITSVMELVGVSSDDGVGKIDYSERPKLVLPPSRGDLPPPREDVSRSGDWPVDASASRRRNADRYARVPNAPPEPARQGMLERALSYGGSGSNAPVIEEPSRRMLTEPPAGYRRPTQDLSKIRDSDVKKSSWWNPLSWGGGGGGDNSSPNPAANDTRGGGAISSLSAMMPSFVRGSSDNDKN